MQDEYEGIKQVVESHQKKKSNLHFQSSKDEIFFLKKRQKF